MMKASGKVAVTCGDPAGVGPEVVMDALRLHPEWIPDVCVFGWETWTSRLRAELGVETRCVADPVGGVHPGSPDVDGSRVALWAMEASARACVAGECRAVATAPVSKHWMRQAGMMTPGQTEFFANQWGGVPTMAFISGEMKVALVTWHVPLRDLWKHLTTEAIQRTVRDLVGVLHRLGTRRPRIAVCGLNPHAGENGQMGDEELVLIQPALKAIGDLQADLSDCLPSDTVFFRHRRGDFDGVVALYHDQGLAPLKTIAFDDAVNTSLGLPFVRTSPDHGTGFDIAGKGRASARSMEAAIRLAMQLSS